MRSLTVLFLATIGIGLGWAMAAEPAAPAAPAAGPEVTLIGNMLCNMQCTARKWDHRPTGPDHGLVLYAFNGTPQVEAEVADIMKEFWPGDTLDGDQARKLMDAFTQRTKYYLVPSPLVDGHHREVEYSTRSMAVTGRVFERDGKRWIDVSKIEQANITYPANMFVPDKPMVMPDKQPLTLKITDQLTMKCIQIPAGKFLCGAPFYERLRFQDEFPHMVTLTRPYYMAETLVTQGMFETVMGVNPSKRVPGPDQKVNAPGWRERMRHKVPDQGADFAVENCTWAEIQEFCKKISEKNGGLNVRVPTQAEWEWAARVGTSTPVFHEKYVQQRSYCGDKEGRCEPVKRHPPNAWGLYDMVKSGWEWVSDYKDDNIRVDAVDPQGPSRAGAARHGSGPLRRMEGGVYYGDTHLTLHGAIDEDGNGEEGIAMFRLVVEVEPAGTAPAKGN